MQIDGLTPEHARKLAEPGVWTVKALLDKLPHVHPWWMRDAVNNSCEDRPELERGIVALMEVQTSELARLYMGLVLFFLAHPLGREAFMAGLRSEYRLTGMPLSLFGEVSYQDAELTITFQYR